MLTRTHQVSWILLLAGFLVAAVGFLGNAMWTKIAWGPTEILAGLAFVSLVLAYGLVRIVHCQLATAMATVWLAALVCFSGVSPFGSVLLVTLASMGLGSMLVPEGMDGRVPLAVLAGLSILCGIDGWLLPFPVHGHMAYTLILLALIIVRWRALLSMLKPLPEFWTTSVARAPHAALFTLLAVGIVSTCAWLPTIAYDDLAYHLGLPHQLATLGYYQMNAGSQVWAIAAWAADVLQGIAQLVAESESRGAVDALWLILAAALMWRLCAELALSHRMRWVAVALYVSMPMTAGLLTGMQTEGPTAAVVAGIALLIQRSTTPDRRQLLLVALLMGLLLGLKVSNLMIAGPLVLWLLWRWGARLPWRIAPAAVAVTLVVAGSSYFYSYLLTGNPVLPIFNGFFHSAYIRLDNSHGPNWGAGLYWSIPWDMTFHTSRFGELGDGSGGFILVSLLGSLLVALAHRRARPLALVAIVAFLLPLTQVHSIRYPHPAMLLLVPAMLCGITEGDWGKRRADAAALLLVLLVLGNLAFVASGTWQLRQGALWSVLSEGRAATLDTFAPTRRMAKIIRTAYGPDARTLIIDRQRPFAAELSGDAFDISWYDQELATLARQGGKNLGTAGWLALFDHTGVNLLVVNQAERTQALDGAIAMDHGRRVHVIADLELWELQAGSAGVELPSPPHSIIVKFDTSVAPAGATIVNAKVSLSCSSVKVPIVISWDITPVHGPHWKRSEWATCLESGHADAMLDVAFPSAVTAFTMSAMPAKPVDLQLRLSGATAWLRSDLARDRNLARRW